MDAALAGPSAAEASSAHEHAAWCQALARAMGQVSGRGENGQGAMGIHLG